MRAEGSMLEQVSVRSRVVKHARAPSALQVVAYSLGGWVVSSTQYASLVSAIKTPFHRICRCRAVLSRSGGRGKFRGFKGAFGGMLRLCRVRSADEGVCSSGNSDLRELQDSSSGYLGMYIGRHLWKVYIAHWYVYL